MRDFVRQPSRTEQWLAILLALLAMLGFSALTSAFWFFGQSYWAVGVFAALFLASTFLLYRAVSTSPRALGPTQTRIAAWALIALGACGLAGALLAPPSGVHRLMILGAGLSLLAAGLGGVQVGHGRDA